jgi:menaquinone reductase, multiheme cytochrome c subunit
MIRGSLSFGAGLLLSLAAGWIGFPRVLYERIPQPLQFSHKVHTGDKGGMKCEDCHSFAADGRFSGVPALEKCSGCHAQPMGDTAAEKQLVTDYVTPQREVPWKIYARQPENAYFSHAAHVTLGKIACERCHGEHGRTDTLRPLERNRISGYSRDVMGLPASRIAFRTTRGMRMEDCVACHRERGLEHSCLDCHK